MKRERDKHPRLRAEPGRLAGIDAARQDLALADLEIVRATQAADSKQRLEHVALARRFVDEASKKLGRLA